MKNKMKQHFKVLLTLAIVCAFGATGYYFFDKVNNTTDYQTALKGGECGNGIREKGEQCDDGNTSNFDSCLANCTSASCGDGYLWTGKEQCDDGNTSNTDSCTNSCLNAACGDGYIQSGETCDDGNTTNGDGCSSSCATEYEAQGPCGSPSECNAIEATFTQVNTSNDLIVGANATIGGNTVITGDLNVTGTSSFSDAGIIGVLTIANLTLDNLIVNTLGTIASLTVSGASTLNSLTVSGALNADGSLSVDGLLTANGGLNVYNGSIYDGYDSVVEIRDNLALYNAYLYDSYDSVVEIRDNLALYNGYIYDSYDNVVEVRDSLGIYNGYIYDSYDSVLGVNDSLSVSGDIKVSGTSTKIGSYYTNYATCTIGGSMGAAGNPGENGYRVSCDTNDYIVGCSAAFAFLETWDPGDIFLGTKIIGSTTCSGRADDGGTSNDDTLYVYARCFDPNGVRTSDASRTCLDT